MGELSKPATADPLVAEAYYRQVSNAAIAVPEQVASIAPEDDHTRPAEVGDQLVRIDTEYGSGKLPVFATHPLDKSLPGIEEITIVTHGCLRNARHYFNSYLAALGDSYDPDRHMVVAPHFPAPVDPIDRDTLRWGYSDWRGGEPALAPSPPISSFDAEDELLVHLEDICPDLQVVRKRNNSEGGQKDDRYLMFGRALLQLERLGIAVEGTVSNPGTVLYCHPIRPKLVNTRARGGVGLNDFEWFEVPETSMANRWPFGMYDFTDPTYGPPPYVRQFLREYPLETAVAAYMRRTTLSVGGLDNDPNGSQLPTGPGPDEQGATRYERVIGKWAYLTNYFGHLVTPSFGVTETKGLGHDGSANMAFTELVRLLAPERLDNNLVH